MSHERLLGTGNRIFPRQVGQKLYTKQGIGYVYKAPGSRHYNIANDILCDISCDILSGNLRDIHRNTGDE